MAGKVAAQDAHEGQTLAQVQRIAPALRRERRAAAQRLQGVVHGHRCRILHEDARLMAGTRALPDDVATQVGLAERIGIGGKGLQVGQSELRIGDPVIEPRHQRLAGNRWQFRQRNLRPDAGQMLAVEAGRTDGSLAHARQSGALSRCKGTWPGTARRQHIQRHRSQPKGIEHGCHGLMLGRRSTPILRWINVARSPAGQDRRFAWPTIDRVLTRINSTGRQGFQNRLRHAPETPGGCTHHIRAAPCHDTLQHPSRTPCLPAPRRRDAHPAPGPSGPRGCRPCERITFSDFAGFGDGRLGLASRRIARTADGTGRARHSADPRRAEHPSP